MAILTPVLNVFGIVEPLADVIEFAVTIGFIYFAVKYFDKKK